MTTKQKIPWIAAGGLVVTLAGILVAVGVNLQRVEAHEQRLSSVEGIAQESIRDRSGLRAENSAQHIAIMSRLERIEAKIDRLEVRP